MAEHPELEALVRLYAPTARITSVVEMPGGASSRKYFRIFLEGLRTSLRASPDGSTPTGGFAPPVPPACSSSWTIIAMYVPDGGRPEEIGKERGARRRWPFLEVRDLLAERGVDVPAIYAENTDRGWLLLEDLGDDTLANYLARIPAGQDATRERLYHRAVIDLACAQRALETLPEGSVIRARAFDADLLRWEIDHFREWGLDARGHALSPAARATFDGIAARLATRIASWPRGFVHRDYQSRNLMVRVGGGGAEGEARTEESAQGGAQPLLETLCWIDFQDALLGPRVYDLVALLNDSYQTFDRAFVEARLRDYAEKAGVSDFPALVEQFDTVTVQRKLKDAGRFVFIDRKKGNDSFLRFVTPTVRKAAESLRRLRHDPDMRMLGDLLAEALPDEA